MGEIRTIYEPHPVSAERKAELRAQGYKILDARFAPPKSEPTRDEILAELERRGIEHDKRLKTETLKGLL